MLHPRHCPARRGTMAIWLALSLAAIIAVVALSMDGGRLLAERQHVQATADASALAAAGILYQEYPSNGGLDVQGNARTAALQMATANGISGTNGTVTVNIPPMSGDFQGKSGYAEVIVSEHMNPSFALMFGTKTLTVKAQAVARGIITSSGAASGTNSGAASGFYVLASTGKSTFQGSGNTELTIVNAPMYVNSSDGNAIKAPGGCTITASAFYLVGGGNTGALNGGPIIQPAPPVSDPLAALAPPSFSAYPVRSGSPLNVNGNVTLQPGVYVGGITVSNGILTLQPGVYLMNGGGINLNNGTVNGTGVTIYSGADSTQRAGAINIGGGATVNLSPPTSGTYLGVTFFQDRAVNQAVTISGSHNQNITGAIYAPAAELDLNGPSNAGTMDIVGGPVICLTTSVKGRFQMAAGSGGGGTPRHLYGLVD